MNAAVPYGQLAFRVTPKANGVPSFGVCFRFRAKSHDILRGFFLGMDCARTMTGLAAQLCGRRPRVSFNGMVIFHIGFVIFFMTLNAGFRAYVPFIPNAYLNFDAQDSNNNDCRQDEELYLLHRDRLLN
jgi:hypothetical protein